MTIDDDEKIRLLEQENQDLKNELQKLADWVEVLTKTKEQLQKRVLVLESSIRNFGLAIGEDL